ncbi:hypothetical protein F5141DRAFT_1107390 [Pisolithus sp. B1]|nr:hypothetical protein F5141DRAFT_1107390 [Pisolithus sp. B1]
MVRALLCGIFALLASTSSAYDLIREYSGNTFFDRWDFYDASDNTTFGNVTWVSETNATSLGLAYVDIQGDVILKVDNTTNVTYGQERNSVRITTQDAYELGSLWLIDVNHIPYGCSVWPAFWSFGPQWPYDGEIDIIEGINLMTYNQMAVHTTPGCIYSGSVGQLGISGSTTDCSQPSGCTVMETSPNSFESGFAAAGGGVWATKFDDTGISIWFWSVGSLDACLMQLMVTKCSVVNNSDQTFRSL